MYFICMLKNIQLKNLFYVNKAILLLIKLTMSSRHSKFQDKKRDLLVKNLIFYIV